MSRNLFYCTLTCSIAPATGASQSCHEPQVVPGTEITGGRVLAGLALWLNSASFRSILRWGCMASKSNEGHLDPAKPSYDIGGVFGICGRTRKKRGYGIVTDDFYPRSPCHRDSVWCNDVVSWIRKSSEDGKTWYQRISHTNRTPPSPRVPMSTSPRLQRGLSSVGT